MSGTIWLTTIQGSSPASTRRQRCIAMPRSEPMTTPMTQPSAARPRVMPAAPATEMISGGVSPPLVGANIRATMSQT
jgi:hypothetical protein